MDELDTQGARVSHGRSPPATAGAHLDAGAALIRAQMHFESEKEALARVLHDDLGGLLVGAVMDLGWLAQQQLLPKNLVERLSRASAMLRSAIDLKRTLIEELQPSLLRTVGIFAALRWHVQRTCNAAGIRYTETYPPTEVALDGATRVSVFRLIQESLDHLIGDGPGILSIDVEAVRSELRFHLRNQHIHDPHERPDADEIVFETAMHYRASGIGGRFSMTAASSGRHIAVVVPVS